ncbi:MAG: hypothetical protein JW931_08940 [Methanomicrobiaceae archaeon]|nr:hypothetical protein [Methanomicrobiaceae archaeon]
MFRIVWDKADVEDGIKNYHPSDISIIDFWIPIYVYVDDVEISGLEKCPRGDVMYITEFFFDLLCVISLFDDSPKIIFSYDHGKQENLVDGNSNFNFSLSLDEQSDILTLNYKSIGAKERRSINMPFKDYIEGSLAATREIISDIERLVPEYCKKDYGLFDLKSHWNLIRGWYEKRYNEPVEEKYSIPQEYYTYDL